MVTEAPTPLNDVSQGAFFYLRRTNRIKKITKQGCRTDVRQPLKEADNGNRTRLSSLGS